MREISDFIGIGIAGLLSILWFDIRSFKKTFITRDEHDNVCRIKELEHRESFREYIDAKFEEIKVLIKNGNSKS